MPPSTSMTIPTHEPERPSILGKRRAPYTPFDLVGHYDRRMPTICREQVEDTHLARELASDDPRHIEVHERIKWSHQELRELRQELRTRDPPPPLPLDPTAVIETIQDLLSLRSAPPPAPK
ncbi:hypothetical protein BGX23_004172 [Mortierella sp. AD031]|nr:hypothetical protein BGX23_004172 [Mortierella sp. AD031]